MLIPTKKLKSGLLKYCQDNDVLLMAWRPIQKGILTQKGITVIDELCQKYHKTAAQIAINWLISQEFVLFPLNRINSGIIKKCNRRFFGNKSLKIGIDF